jgi:hypothetical protein
MPDFPAIAYTLPPLQGNVISPMSECSIGPDIIPGPAGLSGQTLPANRAHFWPFALAEPFTVDRMGWYNAGAVSGNCDAGIYGVDGTRLVSTGSTAQAGTNTLQIVDVTNTLLTRGYYLIAFAIDNNTGNIFQNTGNMNFGPYAVAGQRMMDTAFPLPSSITMAHISSGFLLGIFATSKAFM